MHQRLGHHDGHLARHLRLHAQRDLPLAGRPPRHDADEGHSWVWVRGRGLLRELCTAAVDRGRRPWPVAGRSESFSRRRARRARSQTTLRGPRLALGPSPLGGRAIASSPPSPPPGDAASAASLVGLARIHLDRSGRRSGCSLAWLAAREQGGKPFSLKEVARFAIIGLARLCVVQPLILGVATTAGLRMALHGRRSSWLPLRRTTARSYFGPCGTMPQASQSTPRAPMWAARGPGRNLLLARLRSQSRLHNQVGMVVRFHQLNGLPCT